MLLYCACPFLKNSNPLLGLRERQHPSKSSEHTRQTRLWQKKPQRRNLSYMHLSIAFLLFYLNQQKRRVLSHAEEYQSACWLSQVGNCALDFLTASHHVDEFESLLLLFPLPPFSAFWRGSKREAPFSFPSIPLSPSPVFISSAVHLRQRAKRGQQRRKTSGWSVAYSLSISLSLSYLLYPPFLCLLGLQRD